MKTNSNIVNVEEIMLAALAGKTLKEAGIKETPENLKFWRLTVASSQKMYKSGIDVDIPF